MRTSKLDILEIFGMRPLDKAFREARLALGGDGYTPRTHFDHTSLRILRPRLSIATWLGQRTRRVPIINLFNRTQTPIEQGWSVRTTQVRDFRGGRLSYDSHNGTDLAVPIGTVVLAAASGEVARVSSEFNRGGLKVFIDHGGGLITTSNHLARALVAPGDRVRRGQPIALSGYSGLDGFALFPWSAPHVHFNVWLDGVPVDPFAAPGEQAIWRTGNDPVPALPGAPDDDFTPGEFDLSAVDAAIAGCRDPQLRAELSAISAPRSRAFQTLFYLLYFPTRFTVRPSIYRQTHVRSARIDLPFSGTDFDGVYFADTR